MDSEDEYYEHEHEHHHHNMSRLSVCSSNHSLFDTVNDDDDDDVGDGMLRFMSGLSIDCDADEEFSDKEQVSAGVSSDSDKELTLSMSLPPSPPTTNTSSRRAVRERWLEKAWEEKRCKAKAIMDHDDDMMIFERNNTRKRSLCIDMEEVKACKDLGFQLEIPTPLSVSCSTLDTTSSGGNSPIANWRISSPGDDPKDVKARLKVWAQAVAMASASRFVA